MLCSRRLLAACALTLGLLAVGYGVPALAPDAGGGRLLAQADGGEPVYLAFPVKIGRPILVHATMQQEGDLEVESDDYYWNDDIDLSRDHVFIDEYESFSKAGEVCNRQYVKAYSKFNGEITDSALNGVKVEFKRDDDDRQVELLNDRILTERNLNTLLANFNTLGVWLRFPKQAEIGGPVELDLRLLVPLIYSPLGELEAKGTFILESYSHLDEGGRLSGDCHITGIEYILETDCKIEIKGKMTIDFSASEERILSIQFDGDYEYSDGGKGSSSGEGTIKSSIETEIDPKRVAKQAKRRPNFRTKKLRCYRMGVGLKLPSHYSDVEVASPSRAFVRTKDADKGEAIILVEPLGYPRDQAGFVFDQIYADLKKRNPDVQMRKCKNPLGRDEGRTYFIPKGNWSGEEGGTLMQTEIYPYRNHFLMLKLYGPPAAFKAAHKEFMKAKSTLGHLNPKRSR